MLLVNIKTHKYFFMNYKQVSCFRLHNIMGGKHSSTMKLQNWIIWESLRFLKFDVVLYFRCELLCKMSFDITSRSSFFNGMVVLRSKAIELFYSH
jgi:hypothetical protein